jgi:ubiquinone/menaquinone biosynthesis C-methylase UbiE
LADNEYLTPEHALAYLAKADGIPHRSEGEAVLLSFVPRKARRILDLGTGDGRLLALLHSHCPEAKLIGLDFSPTMIAAASARFGTDPRVEIRHHDLDTPLPDDRFDVVVSSFAIHHCLNSRKRSLYSEIYDLLEPGGVFCNLEHVSSPTDALHTKFLDDMGASTGDEDPSNILLDVQTQLQWLSEIGYDDVDCYWKWLELALFGGVRVERIGG